MKNNMNAKKAKYVYEGGSLSFMKDIFLRIKIFFEYIFENIKSYIKILSIYMNNPNDFIIYCGNPPLKENGIYDYLLQISIYLILYIIPYTIFIMSLVIVIIFIDNSIKNSYKLNPLLNEIDGIPQNLDIINIFNSIYINKYIFIYLVLIILYGISIIICYIFKQYINYSDSYQTYIKNFIYIAICILVISLYILNNNYYIKRAYNKNEKIKNILNEYLSIDYLNYKYIDDNNNTYSICDYIDNKKDDEDFKPSKCNNITLNFSDNILRNYILEKVRLLNGKISSKDDIDFKFLQTKMDDDTGKSYYNLILSAIITHSLINYYIDNGDITKTEEFFSISNILNKNKVSPLLLMNYRKYELLVYEFDLKLFNQVNDNILHDKEVIILELIKSNYKQIQLEIMENIINFKSYNNNALSPSYIHLIILILSIIFLLLL